MTLTKRWGSGVALMVTACAGWSFSIVAAKPILDAGVDPIAMLTVALGASVASLLVMVVLRREVWAARRNWRLGWTGLLEPAAAFIFGLWGLSLTSALSASVLSSLEPLAIPLIAALLFRARTSGTAIGTCVSVAGAIAVVWQSPGTSGGVSLLGDLLVIVSVLVAATYVVLSEPHTAWSPPVPLAAVQQMMALLLVAAVAAARWTLSGLRWPTSTELIIVGLIGVLGYALPFVAYLAALSRVGVQVIAPLLCLIPVMGAVGAAAVGEPIRPLQVAGVAVVVAGLVFALRGATHRDEPERHLRRDAPQSLGRPIA